MTLVLVLLVYTWAWKFFVIEKHLLSPMHGGSALFPYDATPQKADVDVAMAKMIAAEVIICYLCILCKWKTAVLAWFSVFQVQYEVFIDGKGGNEKNYFRVSGRFCQINWVKIELMEP